jgi:hypothetical protein
MHLRPVIGCLIFISALRAKPLHAQADHPSSTTPITRAIAVYEWTGPLANPTAARLLPVSLFIDGQLEDASVYLAQPIPFALRPGTLYLLQQSGQTAVPSGRSSPGGVETIAAFNIQLAHPAPSTTPPAWAAYGRFLTAAEAAAATITSAAPAHQLSSFAAGGGPASPSSGEPSGSPTTPPASPKPQKKIKQQAYVTPPTSPILDDPDRPTLQSGQPASSMSTPELTTLPPDLQQCAAISDAANRPPETFADSWPSLSLRNQILRALETLALPSLTHYLAFNHLAPADGPRPATTTKLGAPEPALSSPKGPDSRTRTHPQPPPTPPITIANEHLSAYTLAATAQPTYILTAELPLATNGPIYLTLIAQPNASSAALHLTLLSITDATHLDRTPWLRPIDAVDPDATGRAALLVELRSQSTRQFALYTLTATQPQQTLLTAPINSPPPN